VSGDEFEGFCGWTEKLFVSCHVLACYQILASVAAQALITISLEFLSCSTLKFVLIFSTRAFSGRQRIFHSTRYFGSSLERIVFARGKSSCKSLSLTLLIF
jgi:hypothetical protein